MGAAAVSCSHQSETTPTETQSANMSNKVKLRYWPIAGRGEFLRVLFAEAGVDYDYDHDATSIRAEVIGANWAEASYEHYAPPLIQDGKFTLSSTHVIQRYLGKKYGLYPKTEDDEWHAEQLNLTIHDYLAEAQSSFRVHHRKTYPEQQEETKPIVEDFIELRVPRFFGHFERAIKWNKGKEFLFGDSITYVDLTLFHALRATEKQWPDIWKNSMAKEYPLLAEFKEKIGQRPKIKTYIESDKGMPWQGDSLM